MKFKEIPFKDDNAKRIYKDYINRTKNCIKDLNVENQNETLLEINSHIYEAWTSSNKNELQGLLDVLQNIGNPEIFLKELVAEKKLTEAAKSFNPIAILKALILNFTNGFVYIIFFILYLLLFAFAFMIIAKIINPSDVGFFYTNATNWILGISTEKNAHSRELLGNWFIPVMVTAVLLFYILITLLLKFRKSFLKK